MLDGRAAMIWSVAQTEGSRERTAQRWLERDQFETYLPLISVKKRVTPLFPSYLFVRLSETCCSRVNNTIGVLRLLRINEKPAKIDDDIISAFRKQEKNGLIKLPEKQPPWRVGERVRVANGHFLGHIGLYDGIAPHDRVYVLLSLFGRETRTELAISDIHKT